MGGEVDLNKRVYRIYSEILTPQVVELLNNNLRQAEALVQKDSVYGKRLGKIHFALDYNMLLLNVSKAYFAYRKNAYSKQALSNLIICLSEVKSFGEHNKRNKGTIRFNGTGWPKGGSLTERLYKSYLGKVKQIENDSD